MEAEISQGPAGAPKGTPCDAKCVTKFSGGKNKEAGVGTKFKIGKLILSKKNNVAARCHILRLKCAKFDFN